MTDKKQSTFKEKLAFCGSYALSGAAVVSASLAVASPFLMPPEIAKETAACLLLAATTFSVAAQKTGNKNKSEKIQKFQNKFTKLALCGFALLTGTDDITADMKRIEEINTPQPYVIRTEKTVDDDMRTYWESVAKSQSISLEEMMKMTELASKTSVKDLCAADRQKQTVKIHNISNERG